MDGQINITEYLANQKPKEPIKYGDRGCRVCFWNNNRTDMPGCYWNDRYWRKDLPEEIYPDCHFMPDDRKGLPMCANCEHSNQFCYQSRPGLEHRKAMYDPVEEPNIYCDHPNGSLNRRTEYKDLEQKNFGVGHWHRQHEWDTCDRWEETYE